MPISPLGGAILRWRASGRIERSMTYARVSVATNVAMAAWKLALLVVSPSVLVLCAAAFNLGMACCKIRVLGAHRQGRDPDRTLRLIGTIVALLALAAVVGAVLPGAHGALGAGIGSHAAIVIAATVFTEAAVAAVGALIARRRREPLSEAIRFTNLAGALMLLPLVQSALLSNRSVPDAGRFDSAAAVALGLVVAAIGGAVAVRGRLLPSSLIRLPPKDRP